MPYMETQADVRLGVIAFVTFVAFLAMCAGAFAATQMVFGNIVVSLFAFVIVVAFWSFVGRWRDADRWIYRHLYREDPPL